jgi:hypothetical protein
VGAALANPSATLYQNQVALLTNDDWWFSSQTDQIASLAPKLGAFDLGPYSADAAFLFSATPGTYTTIVSPSGTQSGVGLAEIFEANDAP